MDPWEMPNSCSDSTMVILRSHWISCHTFSIRRIPGAFWLPYVYLHTPYMPPWHILRQLYSFINTYSYTKPEVYINQEYVYVHVFFLWWEGDLGGGVGELLFYEKLGTSSKILLKPTCGPGPIPMPVAILSWIGCMPDRPCGRWFKVCNTATWHLHYTAHTNTLIINVLRQWSDHNALILHDLQKSYHLHHKSPFNNNIQTQWQITCLSLMTKVSYHQKRNPQYWCAWTTETVRLPVMCAFAHTQTMY